MDNSALILLAIKQLKAMMSDLGMKMDELDFKLDNALIEISQHSCRFNAMDNEINCITSEISGLKDD